MQTYDTYLERIFALPFEDASRIFTTIKKQIENDAELTCTQCQSMLHFPLHPPFPQNSQPCVCPCP